MHSEDTTRFKIMNLEGVFLNFSILMTWNILVLIIGRNELPRYALQIED